MTDDKKMTPSKVREQNLNSTAETETELQAQLITPQDGRAKIHSSLSDTNKINVYNSSDKSRELKESWGLKTAITSDTRLSNLTKTQEIYIQWAINMEGFCLRYGLAKPASTASWLRTAIVEPGLGREGFLRNNIQTIRNKSENVQIEEKPTKRNILGIPIGGN